MIAGGNYILLRILIMAWSQKSPLKQMALISPTTRNYYVWFVVNLIERRQLLEKWVKEPSEPRFNWLCLLYMFLVDE